ncbi:MAG: DUF3343 domain-containing protein [Actinobacteria bacterium]|nr:DUF3343 domain-containing protein [Actinomycetota bacterium]MBU1943129.1 DUF3343 domain-containing protein [Actinomycetota bacterium]MBU2687924.1 DUF3343 domain-containing protein [Actinomycetota bacterium]
MDRVGLLVFESTNIALKTERVLKDAGVTVSVIPTPVEISSGCGISLLIKEAYIQSARAVLEGCAGYRLLYPYQRG